MRAAQWIIIIVIIIIFDEQRWLNNFDFAISKYKFLSAAPGWQLQLSNFSSEALA